MLHKPERPNCRYCGKPLSKYTIHVDLPIDAPNPEIGSTVEWAGPRTVFQVLRVRENNFAPRKTKTVTIWYGRYGGYGDSFFCGRPAAGDSPAQN